MGKMMIAGCLPKVNSVTLREEFPEAMLLDHSKYPHFREIAMERFGLGTNVQSMTEL